MVWGAASFGTTKLQSRLHMTQLFPEIWLKSLGYNRALARLHRGRTARHPWPEGPFAQRSELGQLRKIRGKTADCRPLARGVF